MPSGVILSSGSQGATQEDIEKVLTKHGYEPDKPDAAAETEPQRDAFDSDEAFEEAKEAFTAKQEEAAEEEEHKAESARPKPTRKQRAIEKATKDLRDELRKANERLAALEGKAPKPEAVKAPEAPARANFKSDAEYEEAMFDYRYKLRSAKEQTDAARTNLEAQLRTNLENYQNQVAEFKEAVDDWDEVVNQPIPIHESVYLAIQEEKNGAAVTYYLGKHPDYARKLADMSPLSAVMEVGRLAARLKTGAPRPGEADSGTPSKPKPRLPEPVKPVSTSATSSTLSSREAAQKRDFRAFKAAQRRGV